MKYFSPSYWLKLWVLSAPLFNDKTQSINAKSIDNIQKIKDLVSKNITNLDSINKSLNLSNSNQTTDFINYQTYLNLKKIDKNLTTISLTTELEPITYQDHKHRHEKNRHKRSNTIKVTTYDLVIKPFSESGEYATSVDNIMSSLRNAGIIRRVNVYDASSYNSETAIERDIFEDCSTSTNDFNLVIMPVNLGDTGITKINLVFDVRSLYLQGFILINNGRKYYFHFSGSDVANTISDISSDSTYNLGFAGSYSALSRGGTGSNVRWTTIYESFLMLTRLTNFDYYRRNRENIFVGTTQSDRNIRRSLINVIMVASEALRTRSIRNDVDRILYNRDASIDWETQIRPLAANWEAASRGTNFSDIIIFHSSAPITENLELPNNPRYTYPHSLCVNINSRITRSSSIDNNRQDNYEIRTKRGIRNIKNDKYEWTNNLTKIINKEKNLPSIANHTNDVVKNIRSSL